MKNIISLPFFVMLFAILMISCSKDPSSSSTQAKLFLSKSTVKIGEPLYATLGGQAANTNVAWSSSASSPQWASPSTDSAVYIFTNPGTYTIKANFQSGINGSNDSTNGNIIVTDSIFFDSAVTTCDVVADKKLSFGDQVNLTPVDYSDTGIVFISHTSDMYSHSPFLNSNDEIHINESGFEVDIDSELSYPCLGTSALRPAIGWVVLTGLTNRTYTLAFKFNGVSYVGTMSVTTTQITITWTNSSGVTISPLVIQKRLH